MFLKINENTNKQEKKNDKDEFTQLHNNLPLSSHYTRVQCEIFVSLKAIV